MGNNFSIQIEPDLCIGCKLCVIVCPEGVLDLRSDTLACVVNLEKCTGCLECEKCPENAIKVL